MNRKSFFWPVLTEEEERRKQTKDMQPSTHTAVGDSHPAIEVSGPILPEIMVDDMPVMPTSGSPVDAYMPASNAGQQAGPDGRAVTRDIAPANVPGCSAPHGEPLLVLEDIHRFYEQASKHLVVLEGASLTVRAGEMVALVAPSGAGKSTLLHMAGLLERPNSGEVYIAGQPQSNAPDRARTLMRRSEIGFVYQFHHLLVEFSALENVVLPQLIHGEKQTEAEKRAMELLAYMKVDHRATHRPAELSGGEQQRVAIARAMANAPRVLLADEPTGNLDPNTSEYVFKALNALVKQSGIAALVATHNLFLAERMDRQITLVDGRIIEL